MARSGEKKFPQLLLWNFSFVSFGEKKLERIWPLIEDCFLKKKSNFIQMSVWSESSVKKVA